MSEPQPHLLSGFGRSIRVVILVVLGGLFMAGSVVGSDAWWPFSPWRMFATAQPPSSSVVSTSIEIQQNNRWKPAPLTPENTGLNRAEIEGQLPRLIANPQLLATLARSHQRLHPTDAKWTGLRIIRTEIELVNRQPTGISRSSTVAQWSASEELTDPIEGRARE